MTNHPKSPEKTEITGTVWINGRQYKLLFPGDIIRTKGVAAKPWEEYKDDHQLTTALDWKSAPSVWDASPVPDNVLFARIIE